MAKPKENDNFLYVFFKLTRRGTNISTEFVAGLTTFLSTAYIIFVNPTVLGAAGMDEGAVFTATIICAVVSTLFMGLFANYPIVVAPGMGMNVFFAYTVVVSMGFSWRQALACSFAAAILFAALVISKLREILIDSIPVQMKHAVVAGIGFFITFVGLKNCGIITANPNTLVGLGNFRDAGVLLAAAGIVATLVLSVRKIPAAIFIGMTLTAASGLLVGVISVPHKIISSAPSIKPIAGALFSSLNASLLSADAVAVILSFLLVGFFDMTGILTSIAMHTDAVDANGKIRDGGKAAAANAVGTLFAPLVGVSPTASYVESLAGVAAGGRSGLTAVFAAMFLAASLLFSGLLSVVTAQVGAAALVCVGVLMSSSIKENEWDKLETAVPAFATVVFMALSHGITGGIAVGFLLYPITMSAAGRAKEIRPLMWILAAVFAAYFAFLGK